MRPRNLPLFPTLFVAMQEAHEPHFVKQLFGVLVCYPLVQGALLMGRFITLWVTGVRYTQTFVECHRWYFLGGYSWNENMHTSVRILVPDFNETPTPLSSSLEFQSTSWYLIRQAFFKHVLALLQFHISFFVLLIHLLS